MFIFLAVFLALFLAPLLLPTPALAQYKALEGTPEKLGTVDFKISCNAEAQRHFTRGVALHHSYYWPEARKSFAASAQADPTCAMPYWGHAVVLMGNPFAWPVSGNALKEGLAAVERAKSLIPKSARERDYPDDVEAQIFHAHIMSANYDPNDKQYINQLKAATVLEKLFVSLPDHPGVAHYLIHSYDYPPLAQRGLKAAYRYRDVAPSAPHALHMPSHTFTHLGFWQDSIASNTSVINITRDANSRLHSLDYMAYAYMQLGQERSAEKVLSEIRAMTKVEGEGLASAFALAAIPARLSIERARWAQAAQLRLAPDEIDFGWSQFPHAQAINVFARGLGAARSGAPQQARQELAKLAQLKQDMIDGKLRYWADQADIQIKVVEAWTVRAEGNAEQALSLMQAAAEHEDRTEKSAVTPGPIKPARELLGEMLLELDRPALALVEFEAAMKKEPNRFRALSGAARAAELTGDAVRARDYYSQMQKLWNGADPDSPELNRMKAFLVRN